MADQQSTSNVATTSAVFTSDYHKKKNKRNVMKEHSGAPPSGLIEGIRENAKLVVISGVVLILAGTFAVLSPLVVGLSITIMVGVSLLIGGVGQCFLALKAGALGRGLLTFVVGALMVVAGVFLVARIYPVFWEGFNIANGGLSFIAIIGGITIIIAIVSGLIVGKILSLTGRRTEPYTDDEELITD
jgi:uncharacterized membrane protein HdeD (DUF308 family)